MRSPWGADGAFGLLSGCAAIVGTAFLAAALSGSPVARLVVLALAVVAVAALTRDWRAAVGSTVLAVPIYVGFLAGHDGWQRWLFTGIAIAASVFLVWMLRRGGHRLLMCGLALILGGALGNLWDRVMEGRVTDFLLFHYGGWSWPAFNVADSAITVGAVMLILDSFRKDPK